MKIPAVGEKISEPYLQAITALAKENPDLVVLDADLAHLGRAHLFALEMPEKHIQCGIAEQNMACVAAGLATCGYIPIISTFAVFATKRIADQLSISVSYPKINVKVIGFEGGLISARNGATHQSLEDLAIMRSMPNFVVIDPCDGYETMQAIKAAVAYQGPIYMRMRRGDLPVVFDWTREEFRIGRGMVLREGKGVSIVSTGIMTEVLWQGLKALDDSGLDPEVIHLHTLKPLDQDLILRSARKTGAVVTVENHTVIGGLGSAVAEVLVENHPMPMRRVGIQDCYGETSPTYKYLFEKYGLTVEKIIAAAREAIVARG